MTNQEAIEHIKTIKIYSYQDGYTDETREALDMAISALEIIRCKDCKHYKAYEYTGKLACHYLVDGAVTRNPDDFCSRAERITDGLQ